MIDTDEVFLHNNIFELTDMDENGELDLVSANNQVNYLFVTDEDTGKPIQGLKAYHKQGSKFLELSLHGVNEDTVTSFDDLKPVLLFPSEADLLRFVNSQRVTHKIYNNDESFADSLLRKIDIGTHLRVFVPHVKMQREGFSYLELTHLDDRFNVSGKIQEHSKALKLKQRYYVNDELRFTWIESGGHGNAGDAEV